MLAACEGVKFVSSITNEPPGISLETRSLWDDSSILQYRLDGLSGYVLERSGANLPWRRKVQILPTGFNTEPELLPDGQVYSSIVDNRIAGSGNATIPLFSVASTMSSEQRMELTITDTALLYVNDKDIPWAEINAYRQNNPPAAGVSRVWVQAVMLTQMRMRIASKTETDATVSGAAYGADGKVFNQNTAARRQAYLTMLLVDLDQLDPANPRPLVMRPAGSIYKTLTIPQGGLVLP
jgi:hypothetical protein